MSKTVGHLHNETVDGPVQAVMPRKNAIKLADTPQIAICVPIGGKYVKAALHCDKNQGGCGLTWQQNEGTRTPNLVPFQFMMANLNMQQPLNTGMLYLFESGRLSAEARQIMTKNALRAGVKYILYWDDDTIPPTHGMYTLHNWMERHPEAGAISGVYTTRFDPPEPLIYTEQGNGASWDFEMGQGAEPQPILGAGAGFLMVRATAVADTIEKMKAENDGEEVPVWSDETQTPEQTGQRRGHFWGHDVRFCKLLNEWGWPVYVHGGVLCGHYDIASGRMFTVPEDAPGFAKVRERNINTKAYWDAIYGKEGADTWRTYPEMFQKVTNEVPAQSIVTELGCGVGILGSKLLAEKQVQYKGLDISAQAVAYAKARFLDARQKAVKDLDSTDLDADVVIATELMEHLDEADYDHVMERITESDVKKFIFTVPDDCMGPDEVPEHTALFNEELIRERFARLMDAHDDMVESGYFWNLRIEKADEHHLICVMER